MDSRVEFFRSYASSFSIENKPYELKTSGMFRKHAPQDEIVYLWLSVTLLHLEGLAFYEDVVTSIRQDPTGSSRLQLWCRIYADMLNELSCEAELKRMIQSRVEAILRSHSDRVEAFHWSLSASLLNEAMTSSREVLKS